jgi:uncharacterized protein (DUF1330 family)
LDRIAAIGYRAFVQGEHMPSVEPTSAQMQRLLQDVARPGPVVMINLLRYRPQAAYPPGFAANPCSGREAYQRYGAVASVKVAEAGGKILWMASVKMPVIAPEGEEWDDAILVQYPSRAAFLEMVARADYQAAAPHRTAALADSRLLLTEVQADLLGG